MKRLVVGAIAAVAVLALAAVIASMVDTIRAGEDDATTSGGPIEVETAPAQVSGDLDAGTTSFIGIVVSTLPPEEAAELRVEGGAVVRRVLEGGPASGSLQEGDVIIAINGESVKTSADVVARVRASEPGDTLTFRVVRDGSTLDGVAVTVGQRPAPMARLHRRVADPYRRFLAHLRSFGDHFVRSELVLETDDGLKAFRAVVGTLKEEVTDGSKTFVLVPKDGSDEIAYQIDAETLVVTRHEGDLGGLNTSDETLVVDVDGQVKLVSQGTPPIEGGLHRPPLAAPGLGPHGLHKKGRAHIFGGLKGLPGLWQRLHGGKSLEGMRGEMSGFLGRPTCDDGLAERFPRLSDLLCDNGDLGIL